MSKKKSKNKKVEVSKTAGLKMPKRVRITVDDLKKAAGISMPDANGVPKEYYLMDALRRMAQAYSPKMQDWVYIHGVYRSNQTGYFSPRVYVMQERELSDLLDNLFKRATAADEGTDLDKSAYTSKYGGAFIFQGNTPFTHRRYLVDQNLRWFVEYVFFESRADFSMTNEAYIGVLDGKLFGSKSFDGFKDMVFDQMLHHEHVDLLAMIGPKALMDKDGYVPITGNAYLEEKLRAKYALHHCGDNFDILRDVPSFMDIEPAGIAVGLSEKSTTQLQDITDVVNHDGGMTPMVQKAFEHAMLDAFNAQTLQNNLSKPSYFLHTMKNSGFGHHVQLIASAPITMSWDTINGYANDLELAVDHIIDKIRESYDIAYYQVDIGLPTYNDFCTFVEENTLDKNVISTMSGCWTSDKVDDSDVADIITSNMVLEERNKLETAGAMHIITVSYGTSAELMSDDITPVDYNSINSAISLQLRQINENIFWCAVTAGEHGEQTVFIPHKAIANVNGGDVIDEYSNFTIADTENTGEDVSVATANVALQKALTNDDNFIPNIEKLGVIVDSIDVTLPTFNEILKLVDSGLVSPAGNRGCWTADRTTTKSRSIINPALKQCYKLKRLTAGYYPFVSVKYHAANDSGK